MEGSMDRTSQFDAPRWGVWTLCQCNAPGRGVWTEPLNVTLHGREYGQNLSMRCSSEESMDTLNATL